MSHYSPCRASQFGWAPRRGMIELLSSTTSHRPEHPCLFQVSTHTPSKFPALAAARKSRRLSDGSRTTPNSPAPAAAPASLLTRTSCAGARSRSKMRWRRSGDCSASTESSAIAAKAGLLFTTSLTAFCRPMIEVVPSMFRKCSLISDHLLGLGGGELGPEVMEVIWAKVLPSNGSRRGLFDGNATSMGYWPLVIEPVRDLCRRTANCNCQPLCGAPAFRFDVFGEFHGYQHLLG